MGYMGFGMQKWIYRRKPRKPFTNPEIPKGDTIDSYKREFKMARSGSITNSKTLSIITILTILIVGFLTWHFVQGVGTHNEEVQVIKKQSKKRGHNIFPVLLDSGIQKYYNEDFEGAKSELERALKLEPKSLTANIYYSQSLIILCGRNEINCDLAINQLNNAISYYPKNKKLLKLKSDYYFQQGDTTNALLLLDLIY